MTYDKWGGYGVPIIPALQGYQGRGDKITRADMDRARTLATSTYKAPGLSWFRFGTLTKSLFPAVNVAIDGKVPGGGTGTGADPLPTGTGRYAAEIVIKPGDAGYREGTYDGTPSPLRSFQNEEGWISKYFSTNHASSNVWANWTPQLPSSGYWEIAVYVPSQHATTNNARYKIHGIVGQGSEFEAAVQQSRMDSLWVPLGIFNLDASGQQAGALYLNDLTGETGPEIAFDAVRWRQVLGWQRPSRYLADGFDSPVGSADEREAAGTTWPATWVSTNGYKSRYQLGGRESLHTGDDLVLRRGKSLGQQLCAIASGEVTNAKREGTPPNWGSWGNVIIIRHDSLLTTGQVVYSRYAHVQNMQVKVGDRVVRGQHVADVGDAFGYYKNVPHLHFDIGTTRVLATSPGDWPWLDPARVERDYTNPRTFIFGNRPVKP
jgi:murein DD-endopeptidase MepM/ murein hydrolase activator NlpD